MGIELPQKEPTFGVESVRAGHDAGWLDLNAFLAPDTRMTRGNLYESAFHAFDIPIYDYDLYDNGVALNQSQNCIRIGNELGLCSEDADDSELVTRAEAVHVIYWLMTHEYDVAKPEILDRVNIQNIETVQLDAYVREIKKVPQSILDRFAARNWSYRLDSTYLEDLSKRLDSEEVFECPCTRGKKQPKSLACVSTLWTGCVKNEKSVTTKQDLDAP